MLLKKQISLLIAFLLLVSNSGVAFNVHFCDDKISGISSVFSKEDSCIVPTLKKKNCCTKPIKANKKCCSDQEINLKNKSEKIVIKTISFEIYYSDFTVGWKPAFYFETPSVSILKQKNYYCNSNAPPFYILYSQSTFYC